jgi:hypothetical protein
VRRSTIIGTMTTHAYTVGRLAAFSLLGLSKFAAMGAKTMLPPSLLRGVEETVSGVSQAEKHLSPEILAALKTTGRNPAPMLPPAMRGAEQTTAVSQEVLKQSPWHQYMTIAQGKPGLASVVESPTSSAFRAELARQATPEMLAGSGVRSQVAKSMTPEARELATIPPGRRVR